MCLHAGLAQELPVTFQPELYLQRRGWVLDVMRREGITEILDVGCGEGELLACLCNPAPWLAPPPPSVLEPTVADSEQGEGNSNTFGANSNLHKEHATDEELASLHKDILHPTRIAGLDISRSDLQDAIAITRPPPDPSATGEGTSDSPAPWHTPPLRWEPLEAQIWEGSLAHVNPSFVGVECVVATEVIEHLPEDVLEAFAPVIFGAYHPRTVLVTTPSYTFNARFTAPDAPPEARSGWPDPTRRTARIFRHPDHKFEWTVEEFAKWCRGVAAEWGYDVELDGVGRAVEVDEWGRDEALGWASQIAAFRRRDGEGWAKKRAGLVDGLGILRTGNAHGEHKRLATHRHPAHNAARRPQSLSAIGNLVVEKMVRLRETEIFLRELWFDRNDVAIACGGWIEVLVRAMEGHPGLALRSSAGLTAEWIVHLKPELHHLIPTEPKDVDAVEANHDANPWDPFDDDIAWGARSEDNLGVEKVEMAAFDSQGVPDWNAEQYTGPLQDFVAHTEWGAPQGDWT
ncbi:hypothetical protein C8Q77DRAFT_1216357 [Trametes polyzona]|nr:hypothetical protein C8Q77DRAFT_1216357 [Trametes polyzona]